MVGNIQRSGWDKLNNENELKLAREVKNNKDGGVVFFCVQSERRNKGEVGVLHLKDEEMLLSDRGKAVLLKICSLLHSPKGKQLCVCGKITSGGLQSKRLS